MLSLQTEEESLSETIHIVHTVDMVIILVKFQVTMDQSQDIPDNGKTGPGHVEGGKEADQCPRPGQLNGGCEEVLQQPVLLPSLLRPGHDVQPPVLGHHPVLV